MPKFKDKENLLCGGVTVVPEVALVILVFCQALDGGHENVVIAEKVLKDELREGVAEASVTRRILKTTKRQIDDDF